MNSDLPKLWLTRSLPVAYDSAENWAKAGCACAVSPLLTVAPPADPPPPPERGTALVFTSRNGVRFFIEYSARRTHDVITVGDATAQAARDAGFANVWSANGTSDDVTKLLMELTPKTTPIIHCAGQHVRGAITQDLLAAGYTARRDVYYRTEPVDYLPNLDLSQLSYIALYSPLAAKTLAAFHPDVSHLTTLSISAATDAALGPLTCRRLIAEAPNEAAMIALLKRG